MKIKNLNERELLPATINERIVAFIFLTWLYPTLLWIMYFYIRWDDLVLATMVGATIGYFLGLGIMIVVALIKTAFEWLGRMALRVLNFFFEIEFEKEAVKKPTRRPNRPRRRNAEPPKEIFAT